LRHFEGILARNAQGDSLKFVTAPEAGLRGQTDDPDAFRRNDPQSLANFAKRLQELSGLIDRDCLLR
jgi:hypothetical protein